MFSAQLAYYFKCDTKHLVHNYEVDYDANFMTEDEFREHLIQEHEITKQDMADLVFDIKHETVNKAVKSRK